MKRRKPSISPIKRCKYCNALIRWKQLSPHRWQAMDLEGNAHYWNCTSNPDVQELHAEMNEDYRRVMMQED